MVAARPYPPRSAFNSLGLNFEDEGENEYDEEVVAMAHMAKECCLHHTSTRAAVREKFPAGFRTQKR